MVSSLSPAVASPLIYMPPLQEIGDSVQEKVESVFQRLSRFWSQSNLAESFPLLRIVEEVTKGLQGAFWGTMFAGGVLGVAMDFGDLVHLNKEVDTAGIDSSNLKFRIQRLWLKCMSNLSSTFMTGTYFAEWMKDVQWLDFGVLGAVIKPIGYAASMISSCFKVFSLVGDYRYVRDQLLEEKDQQKISKLVHHRRLALLELALSINSIAWGALGLAALAFSSPILSGLTFATLVLGGPLMIAVICYKKYISDQHDAKGDPCCQHLA